MSQPLSMIRKILRICLWSLAALVLVYLLLLLRFVMGTPSIKVDYAQVVSQSADTAPEAQCAWPLYRQALIGFDFDGEPQTQDESPLREALPGTQRWDELVQWLNRHQGDIDRVRQASVRPILGFRYGPGGDADDPQLFGNRTYTPGQANPALFTILLPHLQHIRELAQTLRADARLARTQGDSDRVVADVAAIMRLGEQAQGVFLIESLVSVAIRGLALRTIHEALTDPQLAFTDAQLRILQGLVDKPLRADEVVNIKGERYFLQDVVQRAYTDDGRGDGNLTWHGMKVFHEYLSPNQAKEQQILHALAAPVIAHSRRRVLDDYNRLMDMADDNLKLPLRQADWKPYIAQSEAMRRSMRSFPVGWAIPNLSRTHETAERSLAARDGTLIGITLARYRLKFKAYPQTLDALVPEFLAELPVDRINGLPLNYRLIDGNPLVYSTGSDNDDDQGRSLPGKNHAAVEFWKSYLSAPDADWILFPEPAE